MSSLLKYGEWDFYNCITDTATSVAGKPATYVDTTWDLSAYLLHWPGAWEIVDTNGPPVYKSHVIWFGFHSHLLLAGLSGNREPSSF
jgi:hypothetical protein